MIRSSHPHPQSSLIEHCRSVSQGMFAISQTMLSEEYHELAHYCSLWMGWAHDILKDTSAFEKHLKKRNQCPLTRHSGGGALISYIIARHALNNNPEILSESILRDFIPLLVFSVVASHHSEIKKIKTRQEHRESLEEWLRSNDEASQAILDQAQIKQEQKMSLADLKEEVRRFIEDDTLFQDGDQAKGFVLFSLLYLSRTFLGALTCADTISAANQDRGIVEPRQFEYYKEVHKANFAQAKFRVFDQKSKLNDLRNFFQNKMLEYWPSIKQEYLYLLKAPTGLGKTIAISKLLSKIHKDEGPSRVYYLAPTTVILNQVADEIQKFNSGTTLLFHYLEKNLSGSDEFYNNPIEREQKMSALDAGLVVTTYHRMIQLLSGLEKKNCALLRGIKEATFILDECQSLTYFQFSILANIFAVMAQFSKIRVVFMSATPQTETIFNNALKTLKTDTKISLNSLLPQPISETIHQSEFVDKRRSIELLNEVDNISKLVDKIEVYRHNQPDKSLLLLVNLAGDAIKLAELLKPDYCITTNLRPMDIKRQLKKACNEMKSGEPIFMIATSIIQAGVDLDFDAGFVELQELRNFRQGCGRVGRNYDEQRGTCQVMAFELIEEKGKKRSSWFKQRFYEEEKHGHEAVKQEISIIRNSINQVKNHEGLLYDSDIESIEKSFETQIFKIQDTLSEELLDFMGESYEDLLNDNFESGQGINCHDIVWYLTDPLRNNEDDEFIVLFTDKEQEIALKFNTLMEDYQQNCNELQKVDDKKLFFTQLKQVKKQRAEIRTITAPYSLRRWNILNALKRQNLSLQYATYEDFNFKVILNAPEEIYQSGAYGWQSHIDEGVEAGGFMV